MMPDYPEIPDMPMVPPIIESKASIKLTKNTKGYNWDIKVTMEKGMTMEDVYKEVERVDLMIRRKFG